jgi:hypothetical protein
MPIHFHSHRATAERLVASQASKASEAAIHTVLAEMHEQAAAVRLNDSLAPLEHSQAWNNFSCPWLLSANCTGRAADTVS